MTTHPAPSLRALPVLLAAALASPLSWAQAPDAAPAAGDPAATLELRQTTVALIEALVEQGLLSRARADELLKKAQGAAAGGPAAAGVPSAPPRQVQRVPYLPESARAQIKDEIRNDVLATAREEGWADARRLPGWLRTISLEGDLRVRTEGDFYDSNNLSADAYHGQVGAYAWSPDLLNTTKDRLRMTLRARLGVQVKASDSVTAGLRIVSGSNTSSPTSESQTLGTNFNRLGVSMDRAWVRWEPTFGVRLEGGKLAVPFDHSDLLFPDDMALDGLAAKGELDLASGLYGFAVGGAFPLEEFQTTGRDKVLVGGQLGMDWAPSANWQLRGAVGVYNFQKIEGQRESSYLAASDPRYGTTRYMSSQYSAAVRQKGNTLINLNAPDAPATASPVWGLASQFRPVDLNIGLVARHFAPYELGLNLDYVRNTGWNNADIVRRSSSAASDLVEMTRGYQLKASFGSPRLQEPGEWSTFLTWRKFERDAWVDAFTDTTWHQGGTNYKGFSLGGQYAFDRKAAVGLRYTSTSNLEDHKNYGTSAYPQLTLSSAPLKIDVVQLDVNLRF